ncbi:MAG: efflux transporter outer membrane subunit [Betaproteobacteria bacterium]|nr:MAG: efflux transporter outer membrane subunit [Betaproteobacteria bacterium]
MDAHGSPAAGGRMSRAIVVLVVLLAGCMMGPDYRKPEVAAPAQYKELEGWRQASPGDELPRGSWWTVFGDATLDELMKRVDISNQNIRAAEARMRQARGAADQARAGLFPTVSANASATRSKSPSLANQPVLSSGAVNNLNLGLSASWEPDLWGSVRRSIEAGDATWQASAAQLEAARLSARSALAQNYFALRVADTTKRLLEETVQGYQRSLELTQNRYASGVAARLDVVQAEVQLKSAQAQLIDVGVARAQLEHAIAMLVGEPPANFSLAAADLQLKVPGVPIALGSELLERRPDIAAAERAAAAANAQIGVAKAAYFPSLTLSGATGFRSASLANLLSAPSRFWSLGAAATELLFDAGARRAVSEQALAAYDVQVATYRQTVLAAFQDVEDNLAALRILEQEATLQDEVVQSARRSLELTNNQYKAGIVSYLNVITAQTTAYNAESTAVNVLGRRLTAAVGLVRALGGGWHAGTARRSSPAVAAHSSKPAFRRNHVVPLGAPAYAAGHGRQENAHENNQHHRSRRRAGRQRRRACRPARGDGRWHRASARRECRGRVHRGQRAARAGRRRAQQLPGAQGPLK